MSDDDAIAREYWRDLQRIFGFHYPAHMECPCKQGQAMAERSLDQAIDCLQELMETWHMAAVTLDPHQPCGENLEAAIRLLEQALPPVGAPVGNAPKEQNEAHNGSD